MYPVAERMLGKAAGTLDWAVLSALKLSSSRAGSPPGAPATSARDHALRLLDDACRIYARDDAELFPEPRALAASSSTRAFAIARPFNGPAVLDLRFASTVQALSPRAAASDTAENATAHVRLFRRPGTSGAPRPMAVLVHGYNSGHYLLEQRVWPLAWLDRIGLDVALFVLPHHGLRAKATTRLPSWPSRDPHVTLEGFRRAVSDLRALVRHFRAEGVPHVGLFGMSLGAYTASLTATLEPLDFLVPVTPLASLVEFAREHGQFGPTAEDPELCARFESALACVSPLARKSRVARGCAVVVAAEEDRITPLPHAERLARHFGAELAVYPGSHLIHVGIGHGYRAARAMLEREAILRTSEGRKVPPRAFAA